PEYAAAETGAQRLGAGFLRGVALGIGLDAVLAAVGFGALGGRIDTVEETLAVFFDHAANAPRVDDVGAEPNDHALLTLARPRSMDARMTVTVSARPSKTASPIRKCPILSST